MYRKQVWGFASRAACSVGLVLWAMETNIRNADSRTLDLLTSAVSVLRAVNAPYQKVGYYLDWLDKRTSIPGRYRSFSLRRQAPKGCRTDLASNPQGTRRSAQNCRTASYISLTPWCHSYSHTLAHGRFFLPLGHVLTFYSAIWLKHTSFCTLWAGYLIEELFVNWRNISHGSMKDAQNY
jgi:hypothetical protein